MSLENLPGSDVAEYKQLIETLKSQIEVNKSLSFPHQIIRTCKIKLQKRKMI